MLHPAGLLALARDLLDQESRALADLKGQVDAKALGDVLASIPACPGKVMVIGAGTSSSIARRTANLLACAGAPAAFLGAGQA